MKQPPCILTIAGSDSGAGAGIQADARTIHALGGYALTAITAITAQNSRGIIAWRPVQAELLTAQIEAVAKDFSIAAIKTGLLPGTAAVRAVAEALPAKIPLVIDPVLGSTSGTLFLNTAGRRALQQRLYARATVITPNWPELAALTGKPIRTFADVAPAARALLDSGCGAVLVKGGHGPSQTCRDFLITKGGLQRWFESPRVKTRNLHGTGCVLSAAIATFLARGSELEQAVQLAKEFLGQSLIQNRGIRLGKGAGPALP